MSFQRQTVVNGCWAVHLQPDEIFTVPPDGGLLICHPDRPPIWCRLDAAGIPFETVIEPNLENHKWPA